MGINEQDHCAKVVETMLALTVQVNSVKLIIIPTLKSDRSLNSSD